MRFHIWEIHVLFRFTHQTMNNLCCSSFQKLSHVVTYHTLVYPPSSFTLSWPSHMKRATGTSTMERPSRVEDYLHWEQEPITWELDTVVSFGNKCKAKVQVHIYLTIWFKKMIGESCIVLRSSQKGRELPSVESNNLIAISKMPYMLPNLPDPLCNVHCSTPKRSSVMYHTPCL